MNLFFKILTNNVSIIKKENKIKIPPLGDRGAVWHVSQVTDTSLYWPQVFKSSENTWATTTKDYFVIYSTDHDTTTGGIYWGEMDSPFFTGFVERGLIFSGTQSETPSAIYVPVNESSITDTVFIYFHRDGDPQQTSLITSSGGILHESTWSDRGYAFNIAPGDSHLGYARIYKRGINDYVAHHIINTNGEASVAFASDPSGKFIRQYLADRSSFLNMPIDSRVTLQTTHPFNHNGVQYAIGMRFTSTEFFVSLFKIDTDFVPIEFLMDIKPGLGGGTGMYKEGDYIYFFEKRRTDGDTGLPYEAYIFDVKTFI